MGCAGSKPSLLNHSSNHVNSPQKGFIIFNAKTIEFIKVYETDLKQKIKEKCEQKLFACKTLKIKGKKLNLNELQEQTNDACQTLNTTLSNSNHEKELTTLDLTIDLVLKYVVEDFDIENFKSNSNHLSLKQIKKDILKKYNNIPAALASANTTSNNNTSTSTNESTSKANTLTKTQVDTSFYKKALTTAIDEFGAVIQEQFILIADFKSVEEQKVQQQQKDESNKNNEQQSDETNQMTNSNDKDVVMPIIEDDEIGDEKTYGLKEAILEKRAFFYKDEKKILMMTRNGRYVLRDAPEVPFETSIGNMETSLNTSNITEKQKESQNTLSKDGEGPLVTPVKPKTVSIFDTEEVVNNIPSEGIESYKTVELTIEGGIETLTIAEKVEEEVNEINSNEGDNSVITTRYTKETITTITHDNNENEESPEIDVKKEIAISILNVGDVLAKTIDRYSIDENVFLANNVEQQQEEKEQQSAELLSPPPPPSPSIQVSTPASFVSQAQELDQAQSQTDQNLNDSTSFSSPSDLISSLSSSSVMSSSSPNKQEEQNDKAEGSENTIENKMSFLMREMENQLSVQLDLYVDKLASVGDDLNEKTFNKEVEEQPSEQQLTTTTVVTNGHPQIDIDEVILKQIYEVDKKVQSVVDTCSEDDCEEDTESCRDHDKEIYFQPAVSNRIDLNNKELCEEIKQISNVIQDLAHTINVSNEENGNDDDDDDEEENFTETTTITTTTIPKGTVLNDETVNKIVLTNIETNGSSKNGDRKSISSITSSNIPVRKSSLIKQRATTFDEQILNTSNVSELTFDEPTNDSFNDSQSTNNNSNQVNSARNSLEPNTLPDIMVIGNGKTNGKNGKKHFKSKLPKRK